MIEKCWPKYGWVYVVVGQGSKHRLLTNEPNLKLLQYSYYSTAVPTKVKKTDLPVLPPESEILPSLDDTDDNFSDELDDEEDIDDQDQMMADEPLETMEEEDEDDDYESEEDTPVVDQDFMNDGSLMRLLCKRRSPHNWIIFQMLHQPQHRRPQAARQFPQLNFPHHKPQRNHQKNPRKFLFLLQQTMDPS